jgi:hypothetical protein
MNPVKQTLKNVADWVLPPRLFRALTHYRPSALFFAFKHYALLDRNRVLHGRHGGERCFILCNGPSIKNQNLLPLKHETVISVSSGYLHPHYAEIAPRYHCLPQITYTDKMTPPVVRQWFEEMDAKLGSAEIFLAHQEYELATSSGAFANRTRHFLCLGKHYMPYTQTLPDLGGVLPRVQSVPILALTIALSMGFKEIYLLGADHDWFVKKEYVYFYEPTVLKDKDSAVGENGIIESTLLDDLPMIEKLWSQYRAVRHIAEANGVSIYNATAGGMLDEFPRVRLEEVVRA